MSHTHLPIQAFAFNFATVQIEIESTLANAPPKVTPHKSMMSAVQFAYAFVLVAYFGVAVAGYYTFGSAVDGNVLLSMAKYATNDVEKGFVIAAQVRTYKPLATPIVFLSLARHGCVWSRYPYDSGVHVTCMLCTQARAAVWWGSRRAHNPHSQPRAACDSRDMTAPPPPRPPTPLPLFHRDSHQHISHFFLFPPCRLWWLCT